MGGEEHNTRGRADRWKGGRRHSEAGGPMLGAAPECSGEVVVGDVERGRGAEHTHMRMPRTSCRRRWSWARPLARTGPREPCCMGCCSPRTCEGGAGSEWWASSASAAASKCPRRGSRDPSRWARTRLRSPPWGGPPRCWPDEVRRISWPSEMLLSPSLECSSDPVGLLHRGVQLGAPVQLDVSTPSAEWPYPSASSAALSNMAGVVQMCGHMRRVSAA